MVTAGHVLDDIAGDVAMLDLRTKEPDGSFKKLPFQIHIRDRGKDLYIKHKEADVAVMYAALPLQVRFFAGNS